MQIEAGEIHVQQDEALKADVVFHIKNPYGKSNAKRPFTNRAIDEGFHGPNVQPQTVLKDRCSMFHSRLFLAESVTSYGGRRGRPA